MYMDTEEFATDFEGFKTDILEMLDASEFTEYYPPAVFMVNREDEGAILYLEEFLEENEELEIEEYLYDAVPNEIRKFGARLIAVVMPGNNITAIGEEQFVLFSVADMNHVEVMTARTYTGVEGDLEMEGWSHQEPEKYADALWPYKQAVSPQG
jgi:hypothetical protein